MCRDCSKKLSKCSLRIKLSYSSFALLIAVLKSGSKSPSAGIILGLTSSHLKLKHFSELSQNPPSKVTEKQYFKS